MCKSDLIKIILSQYPQYPKKVIEKIVNDFFDTMTAALAQGGRVELRGFGTFSLRTRKSRQAHNPSNHEPVHVPEKKTVLFRPGKEIRSQLMGEKPEPQGRTSAHKKPNFFQSVLSSFSR